MYSVSTVFRLIQVFCVHSFSTDTDTVSVEKLWTQNTRIIHDVCRLLILSNEEKTNDYENFEKGMIYMKILKKGGGGVVEKRGRRKRNPCLMRLWKKCATARVLRSIKKWMPSY